MKITVAQKRYFYYNFRFEFDDYLEKMSFKQADKFISGAESIYKTYSDPVERRSALNYHAQNFKKELDNPRCPTCHKPLEPINKPETCSC